MKTIRFNIIQLAMILYVFFCIFFANFVDVKIFNWILKPLLLTIMALYLFFYTDNHHGRFKKVKENMKTMLIITLFYIIIYYISGLVFGFAKNPYPIKMLPQNLYLQIYPLIVIEYIRSALVNENKNNPFMFIMFCIIFTMAQINYISFNASFTDREAFFKYFCSFIIPLIFSNTVYNYLTIKGSYKLVLVYVLIFNILLYVVPIQPALDWFLLGIYNIILPVVMFIIFRYDLNKKTERKFSRHRTFRNPVIYVPLFTVMIVFILFMTGIFKYEPIAIVSNSMNPIFYRGDIVIYSKPTTEELKNIEENTIIIYSKEKQIVAHRVVKKYVKNEVTYYITRGDANNGDDTAPVPQSKVLGIYSCSVKYIGYPSVWLNQIFNKEKPTVETK